ncbi:MAG: helix-turn-helix transcriptional regulator [Eubacterium sp.]|nr:helix-turn-helix transcriptional regulator [Eubacterium sp.]
MSYGIDSNELRKAMIDADIHTIVDLASCSGVDRNTIGAILNNKAKPSASVIEKLAKALSLSGEDIGRIFFKEELA